MSQQRSAYGLIKKLDLLATNPLTLPRKERTCLLAVTGHILGYYPSDLRSLSSREDTNLQETLLKLSEPYVEDPLTDGKTFLNAKIAFEAQCTLKIRSISAEELTPEISKACGVIGIPGAPDGLGRITARNESGAEDGGYDFVAADPGAGGWTYGRYQLASKAGGTSDFIDALMCPPGRRHCLPAGFKLVGARLVAAGGSEAAAKRSKSFVTEWIDMSLNERLMQQAQESYQAIKVWGPINDFFLKELNIDLAGKSCGLREAALSIFTQHSIPSAKLIFSEAVKKSENKDDGSIIKAANLWRLERLGAPSVSGGFYSHYGDVCSGRRMPTKDVSTSYACSYIAGVKERWENEGKELAALTSQTCP